jgi:hypothetical protein
MIRMRMNIAILLLVQAVLTQNSPAAVGNELDEFNLYYINGIDTPEHKAMKSAVLTGQRINQPGRVKSIYNFSDGLILDLIETYQAAGYDGGRNNTTPFWEWMNNRTLMPSSYLSAYWSLFAAHSSVPTSMQASLTKAKNTIDIDRSINEKSIIFAHSQGNFLTNYLIESVTQDDRHTGESCTGTVAVATPATHVANDDPWVTNSNDSTINEARLYLPFGSFIKPANASNPATTLDPSGHFYNETYLMSPSDTLNKIETAAINVADRINQDCNTANCGQPLDIMFGYFGINQYFTYDVTYQTPHTIDVIFEAYYLKDRLQVLSQSGQVLFDTGAEVSGFHQASINYNPSTHGTTLGVVVNAPDQQTGWRLCIDCQQNTAGCNFSNNRKNVSYAVYEGGSSWESCAGFACPSTSCQVSKIAIDDVLLSGTFGTELLTPGTHQFIADMGFCNCNASQRTCDNQKPYIEIDRVRYYTFNTPILFTVN